MRRDALLPPSGKRLPRLGIVRILHIVFERQDPLIGRIRLPGIVVAADIIDPSARDGQPLSALRHKFDAERRAIAGRYLAELHHPLIRMPEVRPGADSTWHQFVIHVEKGRDDLAAYLKEKGIGTIIHYPIPPHLSEAYRYLGKKRGDYPIAERYADEVLSLPMYNGMTEEEQTFVIEAINAWEP